MIKKIISLFKTIKNFGAPKKWTIAEARIEFCKYTENPFSTDFRNYMQRVRCPDSPTGWACKHIPPQEVKKRLDNGVCWIDYPALDENENEIEGVTGRNFIGKND